MFQERRLRRNNMTIYNQRINYNSSAIYKGSKPTAENKNIKIIKSSIYNVNDFYDENVNMLILSKDKKQSTIILKHFELINDFNKQHIINLNYLSNLNKVERYKQMSEYNISFVLLNKTKKIIKNTLYQPEIIPTLRKSLLLRFQNDSNKYLTLELFSFKYSYVLTPEKSKQKNIDNFIYGNDLKYNFDFISNLIGEFYGDANWGFIKQR